MKAKTHQIFEKGLELHNYANTAYPLDHNKVWKEFRVKNSDKDQAVINQWKDVDELGIYIHIPFCEKRCGYCEYAVVSGEESEEKEAYLESLIKEITKYNELFGKKKKTAVGFDIGGGTPSIFPTEFIEKILANTLPNYNLDDKFAISIETTPIIANDLQKMKEIRNLGIERMSMGVQTINPRILKSVDREGGTIDVLLKARDNIREAGFEKYNIDLMYGFANQSVENFLATIQFAIDLDPEFITLYRMRYKGTKIERLAKNVVLANVNAQYNAAFNLLTQNGYAANMGKNTFSRLEDDVGTSAYLTNRVIHGTPYLGMGLGAQGMTNTGLYYNQGAASKSLKNYLKYVENDNFPVQDIYNLPPDEVMAKMICVSFYFGYINKNSFENKFGITLEEQFGEEMSFLEKNGIMQHKEDLFVLTETGKNYINGAIPLFYSDRSKDNLLSKVVYYE